MAKAVLDHCHTKSPLPRDHLEYWESYSFDHVKIDCEVPQMPLTKDIEKNEPELLLAMDIQQNMNSPLGKNQLEESYSILGKMTELKRGALLSHIVVDSYIKQK